MCVIAYVFGGEALLDEIGHQFFEGFRIDRGTRELMVTHPRGLFDDQDHGALNGFTPLGFRVLIIRFDPLQEVIGGSKVGGPGAHIKNIDFHAFAFDFAHLNSLFRSRSVSFGPLERVLFFLDCFFSGGRTVEEGKRRFKKGDPP